MPVSKKFAITFPDALKAQLWERAAELNRQPSSIVRQAVKEWLVRSSAPASVVASITELGLELEPEPDPIDTDPTDAKIIELLAQPAERPTAPDGSPIAPPVTAVITQRQDERCYHFDGNDGVTRWHLADSPCPAGTTWAQRIGAADMSVTLDGKKL